MDQLIRDSARKIVDSITAKDLTVYYENSVEKTKYPEDLKAVTIVLPSGQKIRIRETGEVRRPIGGTNLEGAEFKFFLGLRHNNELAGIVRKMLLSEKFTKRDTARSAAEFAEMM